MVQPARDDVPSGAELLTEHKLHGTPVDELALKYNCSRTLVYARIRRAREQADREEGGLSGDVELETRCLGHTIDNMRDVENLCGRPAVQRIITYLYVYFGGDGSE